MSKITFRVCAAKAQETDSPDAAYPLLFRIKMDGERTLYVGSGLPRSWVDTELKPRFTVYADQQGLEPVVAVAQRRQQLVALDPDKNELAVFDLSPKSWVWRPAAFTLPDGSSFSARLVTIPSVIAFALLWPIWLVLHIIEFILNSGETSLWFPTRTAWKPTSARFGPFALERLALYNRFRFRDSVIDERVAFVQALLELRRW
ncbi:hypothetical protein AB0L74_23135 [Streptomyces sp. NPDC052020]|uniref:hypothetical protein n=1 Tax=Streptomyces sp. NPDC052020 TaxID=3155677 RepID=UPI0034435568